ncbi:YrhB domain-containing protein [Amycolatopsis antarctica]|uniref:YrhB domain-containing protein n=1 Tax=Amycolatopsis antarctica TaxID=1854586 RepID=UPI001F0B0917|nr:YrhB domain-containing protein [Amycolatopsis antarctica]
MNVFAERARAWLTGTYGDLVVLADRKPIRVSAHAEYFGCRHADAREPMLASTICVPKDGRDPFPVANAEPLDEATNLDFSPGEPGPWRWRTNARNCVVAMDAVVDGRPASAARWQPADEAPGWWDRLLSGHFSTAEVSSCSSWAQVRQAVADGGPGTRGVVWLRRALDGRELTGHLLYAWHDEETGQALVFDPQLGAEATTNDREVDSLLLARFHRPTDTSGAEQGKPWEAAAEDFPAAVAKARGWLDLVHGGRTVLVAPEPDDETRRGWLFACTTKRYLETGDWREQMLDAALLVPKAVGEIPFGLPNRDPWTWLQDWDHGVVGLPSPPETEPGPPAWFAALTDRIGTPEGARAHPHWTGVLAELNDLAVDSMALIWLRRRDLRERETVGRLLWATKTETGVRVFDPTAAEGAPPVDDDPFELRVFRVKTPSGSAARVNPVMTPNR